jgi:hypothetical protein
VECIGLQNEKVSNATNQQKADCMLGFYLIMNVEVVFSFEMSKNLYWVT